LLIGQEQFSIRKNYSFSDSELNEIIKNKKNTKILILINRTFFEEDIEGLTQYIIKLSELDIDGIMFSDFGVVQICNEQDLKFELYYNPETLVTNYGQFEFYSKNKISNVFAARELRINELFQILDHKQNIKVGIQGSGYSFMMESK
ncbi:MAG: U32 family peptidase, partial [Mycoplasmoidaceae bacterium]|nr:U32 family peptidase [Mycoplasmoidaceae bacterium]